MKNKSIIIKETEIELKKLLKSSKNPKIHMLLLIKIDPQMSFTNIAKVLSKRRATIIEWQKKYKEGEIEKLLYDGRSKNGKIATIRGEVYKDLEKKLKDPETTFRTYLDIKDWLEKKHNIIIKYKTLQKFLKTKFKTKSKVARPRHQKKK